MSHTPEQAAKLWCPMVRYVSGNGASFNRYEYQNRVGHIGQDAANCHAGSCAMWRWEPATATQQATNGTFTLNVAVRAEPTHGYCGLAGKP